MYVQSGPNPSIKEEFLCQSIEKCLPMFTEICGESCNSAAELKLCDMQCIKVDVLYCVFFLQ